MPKTSTKRSQAKPQSIPASVRRLLAVEASCDPRTIDRALRGQPVRGLAGVRARAVLARLAEDLGLTPDGQESQP